MKSELLATPMGGGNSEYLVTVARLGMQYYGYSSGSASSSIQPSTITINGYSCDIASLTTANNGSAFSPRYYTACT